MISTVGAVCCNENDKFICICFLWNVIMFIWFYVFYDFYSMNEIDFS